ncbi:MAG: helix-turn-helix domain-containing protein, partial [Elusimicrobia bacterium]|nr:helix-turn-helix domain-containing protein [Elusimicrobiota bacterium]
MSDPRPDEDISPKTPGPGAVLRQRRQARGQSLEAVHQATRIPRAFLQALEEDRYSDLPAPVYARGFLKSYCDHLDVDAAPLWRQVEAALAPEPAQTPPERRRQKKRAGGPPLVQLRLTAPSVVPLMLVGGLVAAGVVSWGVIHLLRRPARRA